LFKVLFSNADKRKKEPKKKPSANKGGDCSSPYNTDFILLPLILGYKRQPTRTERTTVQKKREQRQKYARELCQPEFEKSSTRPAWCCPAGEG
jgi:hypothetical protein